MTFVEGVKKKIHREKCLKAGESLDCRAGVREGDPRQRRLKTVVDGSGEVVMTLFNQLNNCDLANVDTPRG
jgi:hypothetical protein